MYYVELVFEKIGSLRVFPLAPGPGKTKSVVAVEFVHHETPSLLKEQFPELRTFTLVMPALRYNTNVSRNGLDLHIGDIFMPGKTVTTCLISYRMVS